MRSVRRIFKFIFAILIGIGGGLLIVALIMSLFTDITVPMFFDKLVSLDISETLLSLAVGFLGYAFAFVFLIIIHELGHLVAGLICEYKFISFRIFNWAIIKKDGHYKVKEYGVAGTGGQCLLDTPDVPADQVPVFLYNAGGILANILVFILILPLMWVDMPPLLNEFVFVFLLADALMILINGIPMNVGGLSNDANNILYLMKNSNHRESMIVQLKCNALLQQGMRPKELPLEWFCTNSEINYKNSFEVILPLMKASVILDQGKMEEALNIYENLYLHKEDIVPLYVKEIKCELIFLRLLTNQKESTSELLDSETIKYLEHYSKVMTSKARVRFAIALILEGDLMKAQEIYLDVCKRKDQYLLLGEVESDIEIMGRVLQSREDLLI